MQRSRLSRLLTKTRNIVFFPIHFIFLQTIKGKPLREITLFLFTKTNEGDIVNPKKEENTVLV